MNKIIKRKNRTKITKENTKKIRKRNLLFLGLATVVHVHISPKPIFPRFTCSGRCRHYQQQQLKMALVCSSINLINFFSLKNRLLLTSHPCERDDCISGNNLSYVRRQGNLSNWLNFRYV